MRLLTVIKENSFAANRSAVAVLDIVVNRFPRIDEGLAVANVRPGVNTPVKEAVYISLLHLPENKTLIASLGVEEKLTVGIVGIVTNVAPDFNAALSLFLHSLVKGLGGSIVKEGRIGLGFVPKSELRAPDTGICIHSVNLVSAVSCLEIGIEWSDNGDFGAKLAQMLTHCVICCNILNRVRLVKGIEYRLLKPVRIPLKHIVILEDILVGKKIAVAPAARHFARSAFPSRGYFS